MNLQEQITRIQSMMGLDENYDPSGDEYTPGKFVVHKSNPIFRKQIKKQGLTTQVGECYQIKAGDNVKCKPAIFATDSLNKEDMFDDGYDDDTWIIDTECAGVTWYRDAHFVEGGDFDYHIVTFENIPLNCIKLIHKGTGESIW